MSASNNDSLLDLFSLDYEKSIDVSLKLEQTKLTYQRFYISLVSLIGTVSIGFLNFPSPKSPSPATIEVLIGLLLLFSSILGYTIIRNLVSIRRQCIYFNNAIIYLREQLIVRLQLDKEYPTLKRVPANHHHSADYITILLCSFVNLAMLSCGFALLLNLFTLSPIAIGLFISLLTIIYIVLHIFTIEKVLNTAL